MTVPTVASATPLPAPAEKEQPVKAVIVALAITKIALCLFAGGLACYFSPTAALIGALFGTILFNIDMSFKTEQELKIAYISEICLCAVVSSISLFAGTMNGLVACVMGCDGLMSLGQLVKAFVR